MNAYTVIESVMNAVQTLRPGSPDVHIEIEPPYPEGFTFNIQYASGCKENDSVVCQIALTQRSLFDGSEVEIWKSQDISCNTPTELSRLLEGAVQTLDRYWTTEDLEKAFLVFQNLPVGFETECIERNFLHFSWGTHCAEVRAWFDERYPGGIAALYAWVNKDLPNGKAYSKPLSEAIRKMDDPALAKLMFHINRQDHKFSTIEEAMHFLRMPAGQYIARREKDALSKV